MRIVLSSNCSVIFLVYTSSRLPFSSSNSSWKSLDRLVELFKTSFLNKSGLSTFAASVGAFSSDADSVSISFAVQRNSKMIRYFFPNALCLLAIVAYDQS